MTFASSGAPEVPLVPYDNVLIVFQPEWDLQHVVVVEGHVKHPGKYALLSNSERFSDIIKRAGGFASDAFPEGTVIKRAEGNIGQIAFDAIKGLRDPGSSDNIPLRHLDTVAVPPINPTVTVRGAVNQPTTVAYAEGKNIDYYINVAGGFSKAADEDRTYVIQPGGKMESTARPFYSVRGRPRPRAGSVIAVPEKDPNAAKDRLALITSIAQTLTAAVAIIYAVTR